MGKFHKETFGELLDKAKGDRSINNYAQRSGVDSAHISRMLRGKLDNPPTPATIKKLAAVAQNNINYTSLMIAAGHIDVPYIQFDLDGNIAPPDKLRRDNLELDYRSLDDMVKEEISFEDYKSIREKEDKDEKDIAKRMEQIRNDLTKGDGLSFDGEPMSEEAIESLLEAMEYAVRQTQRINKKYIPKKYRKEENN